MTLDGAMPRDFQQCAFCTVVAVVVLAAVGGSRAMLLRRFLVVIGFERVLYAGTRAVKW